MTNMGMTVEALAALAEACGQLPALNEMNIEGSRALLAAMELIMEKVGTLCCAASDTIEESWRVNEELSDEKGEIGTGEPQLHCPP